MGYDAKIRGHCINEYPGIEDIFPTFTVLLQTTFIMILALAVELFAICVDLFSDDPVHQPDVPAPAAAANDGDGTTEGAAPTRDDYHLLMPLTHPPSTPSVRANRLVATSFIMIPLTIIFAFRFEVLAAVMSDFSQECIDNTDVAYPNWSIITICNILPYASACIAWLHTFINCVLVRWNKSVPQVWTPALPFVLLLAALRVVVYAVLMGVRGCVLMLMGVHNESEEDDIEMNVSEEERRLVANMNGGEDDDEDGDGDGDRDEDEDENEVFSLPPAYDEVVASTPSKM
ncbi:hypothetical protein K504DRAFT_463894, partial [Pleomassaria siparia CBS 279.74]